MKKLLCYALTALLLLPTAANAQTLRRGRIINTTDYTQLAIGNRNAKRVGSRETAPLPCKGSPKVPVVLVQFSDLSFTVAGSNDEEVRLNYNDFFNQPEGRVGNNYASVMKYFSDQSYGQFTPDFSIIGPVRLANSYSYYGKGVHNDENITKFYSEACQKAISEYDINWSDFDNNSDGVVDFVFFIYAGEGENGCDDPNTIWPKEGGSKFKVSVGDSEITFGGYGCTNEKFNTYWDGVGTCCHELSHGIGLPDFYDVGNNNLFGLDYWDLMDSGCYTYVSGFCPVSYSAYEREFMGWKTIETVAYNESKDITLNPYEDLNGNAVKIVNPSNKDEYFIFENRQAKGWDTYLGQNGTSYGYPEQAHGMLVFHVDYSKSAWEGNNLNVGAAHQRMTILPADGSLDSYSNVSTREDLPVWLASFRGDSYPGLTGCTEMSDFQTFNGQSKLTGSMAMKVTEIVETSDGVVSFKLNGGTVDGISEVNVKQEGKPMYNILGQRTMGTKGIVIVNGKKFLAK